MSGLEEEKLQLQAVASFLEHLDEEEPCSSCGSFLRGGAGGSFLVYENDNKEEEQDENDKD